MKRIAAILEITLLVTMFLLCGVVFMAGQGKVPYVFGHRILQVITDSMQPTIPSHTCIIIRQIDQEDIKVGDIITFVSESPDIRGFLNTHRVHEIKEDEESGETLYITIGDASDEVDPYPVQYEQIAGEYVGELPFGELLFKLIRFLEDQVNYFVVVMLPLFLCCMSYIRQLFKALFDNGEEEEQEASEEQTEKPLLKELEIIQLELEDLDEFEKQEEQVQPIEQAEEETDE